MSRRMRRRRSARQSFAVAGIYVWLNVSKSLWDAALPNGFLGAPCVSMPVCRCPDTLGL